MKLLFENPDALRFNGKVLSRHHQDVYTFGYYQVEQYEKPIGPISSWNFPISKKKEIFLIDKVDFHGTLTDNYLEKNQEWKGIYRLKDSIDITGRFWLKSKVISIWKPDNNKKITISILNKLIKDIYKETNIKITDDWDIEIKQNQFKKIGEFLGKDMKMKYVDPSLRHIMSPTLKQKINIDGFGSDKYNKLAKNNRYNSVAQMNYYHKNKYFENLSLMDLLKESINAKLDNRSKKELINNLLQDEIVLHQLKWNYIEDNSFRNDYKVNIKDKEFLSWLDYDIDFRLNNLKDIINKFISGNSIRCWRAMIFKDDKFKENLLNKKINNVGIYWSWDKNFAEPHWGYNIGSKEVLLQASIPLNSIDWKETFISNLKFIDIDESEKEITLKKNSIINLEELNNQKLNLKIKA